MALEISFKGKHVLVTGAGNGIGLALCEKLWSGGAHVVALDKCDQSLDKLVAKCPGVVPVCVDLLDWEGTRLALNEVLNEPLHGLVNNAGIGGAATFMKTTPAILDPVIGLNVKAIVNVSQVVVGQAIAAGRGCNIVNVSSLASRFPTRASCPYNLSKAGVDMLTKSMAFELGRHKIRVNSVNPNIVMTALAEEWMRAGDGAVLKGKLVGRTPLGRVGAVSEVVDTILFLLSDSAPMIHGQSVFVDGGFSAA